MRERELARPAADERDGGSGRAREGGSIFEDLHEDLDWEKGWCSGGGWRRLSVAECHGQLVGCNVYAGLIGSGSPVLGVLRQCRVVCERR